MFFERKNNIDQNILAKIKDAFLNNDVIVYDPKIEGQKTNDKNQYLVGPWAGPQADISNLLHEVCHFAEREIDKLKLFPSYAWGFSFGKYWELCGQSGYEPSTAQAVLREQRVWAYQLSMLREYGIDEDPEDLVKSVVYVPAWCYYKYPHKIEKDGKYEVVSDRTAIKFLAKETDIMSRNEYTYEAFCREFHLRVDRLQNVRNAALSVAV
jgi:hypothetical protein